MRDYLVLLRDNRGFRFIWLGSVVSQIGDWFNLIAAALLIGRLSDSGVAISYLFLARFLPLFFFSSIGGVLADRFDRRRIMIVADLLRAVIVWGFVFVREPEQVWLFYGLTIIQFGLSAVFTPARSAIFANVVDEKDLVVANGLDSVTWSAMLAVGSLLGGIVARRYGEEMAFLLDGFTFLVSAWLISRVVGTERPGRSHHKTPWSDIISGVSYLWATPFLFGLALVKAGGALVWGAINVLEVNFAEKVFPIGDGGATTLGILYAISGLGTGLGPLVLRRWFGDEQKGMLRAIGVGFVLIFLGIIFLSIAPDLAWFGLATAIRTIGSGVIWVFSAALLQLMVPDRFRGRVFAFEFAVLTLTQSFSIYWAGFAQDGLGWDVRQVTLGMGVIGAVVWVVWAIFYYYQASRPEPTHSL